MELSTRRVLRTMFAALLAMMLFVSPAVAQSQTEQKIAISAKEMPMRQFLSEVERQCNYSFFYSNSVLNNAPNVTINSNGMELKTLLHKVFDGTSLTFEFVGNKIAIKRAAEAQKPNVAAAAPAAASKADAKPQRITGTVVDENGKPMVGVGVIIVSTIQGVVTEMDGKYEIKATPQQELQFSFLGYKTETVKVGARTQINVSLIPEAQAMESIVVTALGIKRDEKSLGYAAQKVGGENLASATNASNWLSGLTGQVAGLNIQQANSGPGGTTRVTLRGESSVDFSNNTALFVVDGVPMFNTATESDAGGEGSVYAIDYGDGTGDINPEDIESVTVLKGPAATALYGSAAANGAIIITTKGADKLESKMSITYSTSLTFETVNTSPDLQYEYGQGSDDYFYFLRTGDTNENKGSGYDPEPLLESQTHMLSWGAKMDGTPYYQYYDARKGIGGSVDALGDFRREKTPYVSHGDWFKDYFETGYTWSNSVSVSGRINKRNWVRVSARDFRSHGITPNSPANSQHIALRTRNEITKWFSSEISLNYRRRHCDNIPTSSGYGSNAIMYSLWCYGPNIDMDWVKNYWMEGQEGIQQDASLSGGKNNAYFLANESVSTQNRDRIYGNVKFDFNIYKGLTLMVRGGLDSNTDFRTQQTATSTQADPDGFYREQSIRSMQYSGEFLFRYTHDFAHDINLTANFGGSIINRHYERHQQWADNLKNPSVYSLANSASLIKTANNSYKRQTNSLYGMVQFSWKNAIFVDITGRNDWSSTLPASNRSYFYPSVSGSIVLDELLDFGKTNGVVNMMKIRGSWAQVGHDTAPYRIEEYLASTLFPGNVTTPTAKVNGTLKPEMVSSWEVGLDLRMFRNRFNLDVAYYRSHTKNALASMPVSAATGMTRVFTNAGSILNHGVEISARGTIVRTKDITWNINANWSLNRNKILELGEGIDYWQISQYSSYAYMYAYVGSSLTSMYGRRYKRAPEGSYAIAADGRMTDVSGQIVHDITGSPMINEEIEYVGECMPKWRGGFGTSFTWKGLTASIKFDGQYGGSVWSLTNWVLNYRGKGIATLEGREGGLVPQGVMELNDGNYKICNVEHTSKTIQTYYQAKYDRNCAEANFVETSFLKLREVRLSYSFPKKLLAKSKVIHGLSIAVFGNNLHCWSKFPGFDPEAVSMRGAALSPGFDLLQMPGTASYGGSISITF